VGLLLCALQADNINQLLHSASAAGAAAFQTISTTAAWQSAAIVSMFSAA